MGPSEKIIYTRAALRIKVKISKAGTVSVLHAGNANLGNYIMEILEAKFATFKYEILQVIRAGSLGTASAAIESSCVTEKERNKVTSIISGVVDKEHLQQMIEQSTESHAFSAKPTTCSKVVGRKERRACNNSRC